MPGAKLPVAKISRNRPSFPALRACLGWPGPRWTCPTSLGFSATSSIPRSVPPIKCMGTLQSEKGRWPMSFDGTVINGVIVLDEAETLAEGTRVEVVVKSPATHKPTLAERLLRHAGTVPDLPADMAEQHDHYIHGTPKR